jgi:hypothetical protein
MFINMLTSLQAGKLTSWQATSLQANRLAASTLTGLQAGELRYHFLVKIPQELADLVS